MEIVTVTIADRLQEHKRRAGECAGAYRRMVDKSTTYARSVKRLASWHREMASVCERYLEQWEDSERR